MNVFSCTAPIAFYATQLASRLRGSELWNRGDVYPKIIDYPHTSSLLDTASPRSDAPLWAVIHCSRMRNVPLFISFRAVALVTRITVCTAEQSSRKATAHIGPHERSAVHPAL